MPHQTIGVAWMVDKEQGKFNGGCLADDMGLGKVGRSLSIFWLSSLPYTIADSPNVYIPFNSQLKHDTYYSL
jgi:SNF2 family DNA or RNA helicase